MKATMKKIVLGAAVAAMAVSAVGISAYAAEKQPGEAGCNYVNEYGKHPGECGFNYTDGEDTAAASKQPGYLKAAEDAVRVFIAAHPEYKIISTAVILGEDSCFYRIDAENEGVVNGPRMIFLVNDQICRKVDEKLPGKDGYKYEEEFNELGYTPSMYTEEQIKQIEAFRKQNGFISATLLVQFDEENAAVKANGEKMPGEAGCNYVNENGKHPGESGYCYDANELGYDPSKYTDEQIQLIEASRNENGFVCGTLLMQFDEENAAVKANGEKMPGEAGCNYVNENGKHPGESGYCYDANELGYDPSKYTDEQIQLIEASRNENGFVCGTLLMQFDEENAAVKANGEKMPGEAGCNYVNENGKHPGESGYCYDANTEENENVAQLHATAIRVLGDVNCDGKVDVTDSVLLSRFIGEDETAFLSAQGKINADMDGDGSLTIKDNTLILNLIAKIR